MKYAQGGLLESVHDALASKATATLHSRAGPILRYVKFWQDVGGRCFPITEPMIYDYLKSWKDAAPGAFRSLLISLSFAFHILGLSGGDIAMKSGRVKGVANSHFCMRKKITQRPPLTVEQVTALENIVKDNRRTAIDRVAAGYFLLLVFGKLRYSDGMQISALEVDAIQVEGSPYGFLECKAERTKTSISLERKVRFLPVVVPLLGFTDSCWIFAWTEVRKQQQLRCGQGIPLMPSPMQDGSWSKYPLLVSSAGDWLRSLLKASESLGTRIATHSCKATLLSMCAKFGIDHTNRRMLGYHTCSKDKSLLIYSRDSMASPLRKLGVVIQSIKDRKFFLDHTRSGYFAEDNDIEHAEPASDDDASADSESRDSESEEEQNPEQEEEEEVVEKVAGSWKPKQIDDDAVYVRHKTSRCLHVVADEGGTHLRCGRGLSSSYVRLGAKPGFVHPACQVCMKL